MTQARSKTDAIKIAMDAEQKAHNYYSQSAQKAINPKGKELFSQLAAFELNHYNYLKSLLTSLQEGNGWISYAGAQFSETPRSSEAKNSSTEEGLKDDVLSILSKAIEDEKNASAYYTKLAEETDDPAGKEMFKKLAEEEKLHTKILNDQWYSLSNQGSWVWSD
jgi:rubrerythrin